MESEKSEKQTGSSTVTDLVATFVQACRSSVRNEGNAVVWEHFEIEGAGRGHEVAPTVAALPERWARTFIPSRKQQFSRTLLHDFSGRLDAGEMLMVIGRPGSGCSTFLKSLSHMHSEYKSSSGSFTYAGVPADFKKPTAPLETTFCAEEDLHFPTLTVQQTLGFAVDFRFRNVMSRPEAKRTIVDLARLFGIDHVLPTKVGDEKIRGVSGGEKKRVTLAEALVTCPDLICYDNPTAGLDSSTAIEFIEMMREYTRQTHCSLAASIYQGSDVMVPMFDKALVINSGYCIYYGPMDSAKSYFEGLGFYCPPSMSITDFLNSMSADPDARHIREDADAARVPRSPEEFATAFKKSQIGEDVMKQVREPVATAPEAAKKPPMYPVSMATQIFLCMHRQFLIWISDYNAWIVEATCMILQSLVLGTVFRNLPHDTQSLYQVGYVVLFAALVPALQSMSEFSNTFAQRPLLLKHKSYRLYHPMSYAYGQIISDLVLKIPVICYNIPMYFLANLQRTAGHFFIFFFNTYITHVALSMFFRLVAVLSSNVNRAGPPVGIFFLILVVYQGQYVPPPVMHDWLRWIIYLDPLYYSYESLMINEAGHQTYTCSPDQVVPRGPGYNDTAFQSCAIRGSVLGSTDVEGAAYLREQYGFKLPHLWRDIGINAAIFIFFAVLVGFGMELFKPPAGRLATVFYSRLPKNLDPSYEARNPEVESQTSSSRSASREDSQNDEKPPVKEEQPFRKVLSKQQSHSIKGHSFAFKDLHLTVKTKEGEKTLLNQINGSVAPSTVTALMGVSGAGKTTLLNTLSGRIDFGKRSGTLYLDGKPLPSSFRRRMGYVQQQDVHLPSQTVREALLFPAFLRRGPEVSAEEKARYVEEVLEMLEIEDIADALIGVPGAGLNLEQRKRVSMGVEMAAKPDILFLDEPTSGLDGQSAISMTQLMKRLSRSGQTILCTIHQPSAAAMEAFDNLILLAKGGLMTYQGPYGENAAEVLEYFGSHTTPCDPTRNPAEYLLATVGAGSRSENTTDWAEVWSKSEEAKVQERRLDNDLSNPSGSEWSSKEGIFAMPFFYQLKMMLRRTWLWYWRDPDYVSAKIVLNIALGLVVGLTWLNIPSTQAGGSARVVTCFISLLAGPPIGLALIPRFVAMRDVFVYRERASRSYHWITFIISAIVVELPYTIISSLLFFLLWYFPTELPTDPNTAGYMVLVYWLGGVFILSFGYLLAAWMPSQSAALMANGFFYMWINTFGGVLTAETLTPSGWRWYFNVSPLYYLIQGMSTTLLHDHELHCKTDELVELTAPNGMLCSDYMSSFFQNSTATGFLQNPNATGTCQYCQYRVGQELYGQYGYDFAKRYPIIGIFIGFIAFNFTAVFVGTYLTKLMRWKRPSRS